MKSGALESFQISVSSVFDSASEYRMGYVKGAAHIVDTKITAKAIGAEAKVGEFAYTPGSPDLGQADLEFMKGMLKSAAQSGQE
ncbi:hypothetical protein E5D57_000708 [Metarhizium anisopliae]|nr:hypothetical protein E5D57_000708 [Metarhizium anisopliae]